MNQKGFTLIELLIVISIISFLASTFFPTMNEARAKAEDVRRIASLKNVQTEIANQTNIGQLSYATIFSTGGVAEKVQMLISQTGVAPSDVDLKADVDTYAVVFPLQKGGFWCVDSEGVSKYVTAHITATSGPYSCAQAVNPVVGPGAIDQTWTIGTPNGPIYRGALQSDGKVLLSGNFTLYNGVPSAGFVRLNSDGTVDTTFTTNAANIIDSIPAIEAIAIQEDGKVLVGGPTSSLKRLNTDGTLDYDFEDLDIYDIALQSDGTIITARATAGVGRYDPVTGVRSDYDNFSPGGFVVKQVAVLPSDAIVATGSFNKYQQSSVNNVVWMDATGGYVFGGSGFDVDTINDIFVDTANSVLYMIGAFTTYNGQSARSIVRTTYDGSPSTDFDSTIGFTTINFASMLGVSPSSDKIVVVGDFSAYENIIAGGIVRLNATGHFDEPSIFEGSIDVGNNVALPVSGFTGIPYVILIQSDGKMVIAGNFSEYKGVSVGKVIRVNP